MIENFLGYFGAAAPVVVVGIRNVFGWLAESFKDGKIQSYEFKRLAKTLLSVGSLALFLSLGTDLNGVDSAGIAAAIDVGRNDFLEPILKSLKGK